MFNLTGPIITKFLNHCALLCCAIALTGSSLILRGQTRELALAKPSQHLNDFADVVEPSTATRLENVLANLNNRTGINFVAVVTKTAGPEDLYVLSSSLANQWTIGSAASID